MTVFSRRYRPTLIEKLRETFWPKAGWRRWAQYIYKRILRLTHSPHAIALGFCAGVFASFTPFIGFHFVIGLMIAWFLGGSLIASAMGTAVGNPLTFPAIWAATYHLGSGMLGSAQADTVVSADAINIFAGLDAVLPFIQPMVIGGIPLGLAAALLVYFPVRGAVRMYQAKRSARINAKKINAEKKNAVAAG